MIGYRVSQNELEELIKTHDAKWLGQAATRTTRFKKKKKYEESSSIWSRVKVVYMRLQGNSKCAYCERQLESETFGKIEQDVEHFRPKASVRTWDLPMSFAVSGIKITAVPKSKRGYYLLPYHPFNYAAACKPCNSALKSDCFPIAGKYTLNGSDPAALRSEKPLLIYPIGDFDDAPEDLIEFHAASPRAVAKRGYPKARAMVTIEFFKLDDVETRGNLVLDRARLLIALYPQLVKSAAGSAGAQALVNRLTASSAPHANCTRSLQRLVQANPAEAARVEAEATALILSKS
jgi:hypothetical protein